MDLSEIRVNEEVGELYNGIQGSRRCGFAGNRATPGRQGWMRIEPSAVPNKEM